MSTRLSRRSRDVVARHEVLRTTYREIDGVPYQIVNDAGRGAQCDGPAVTTRPGCRANSTSERRHIFDLERDLPIRAAVLSTRAMTHVLSLVVHHIAADHWSAMVLFTDLLAAYRARHDGQAPSCAPLPVQYADYAAWQAGLLADTRRTRGRAAGLLARAAGRPAGGPGPALRFRRARRCRADRAMPSSSPSTAPPAPSSRALSRDLGVTEFMLLQAAVAVALHKAGEGADIPLGTPGRRPDRGRTRRSWSGSSSTSWCCATTWAAIPRCATCCCGPGTWRWPRTHTRTFRSTRWSTRYSPVRSLSRNPLFGVVVHVREALPADRVIDAGSEGKTTFTALEPTFDVAHADLSLNFFATDERVPRPRHLPDRAVPARHRRAAGALAYTGCSPHSPTIPIRGCGTSRSPAATNADRCRTGAAARRCSVLDHGVMPSRSVSSATLLRATDVDEETPKLRPTGERARWTEDGRLEYVDVPAAPRPSASAGPVRTAAHPTPNRRWRRCSPTCSSCLKSAGTTTSSASAATASSPCSWPPGPAMPGVALTARMVFEHPAHRRTRRSVVDAVRTAQQNAGDVHHAPMTASGLSADELAAADRFVDAIARRCTVTATATAVSIEDVLALSPLQQGLYSTRAADRQRDAASTRTSSRWPPTSPALSMPTCCALRGGDAGTPPQPAGELLSPSRPVAGKPVQVIPDRVEVPWRHVTATADEVAALEADERRRPFDLAHGPAIRFLLIELPSEHWRLVVVAHHIVIDGWSLPLFVGELITLYRSGGDADALPPTAAAVPRLHRLARRPRPGGQPRAVARPPRRP